MSLCRKAALVWVALFVPFFYSAYAQKYHFYRNDGKHNVYSITDLDSITFTNDTPAGAGHTHLYFANGAYFNVKNASLDSITLSNQCVVAALDITTAQLAPIVSKEEYISCSVLIDGKGMFPSGYKQGRIRGRGNSTWHWYPKKPYRIKLNTSSSMLGLKSNKDWVLLANYRDPTFLMNAFAFELADYLEMPFANNTRFCEVTLNGQYLGIYHLTEQVETGGNRVAIDEVNDVLLSLDVDDGGEPSSFRSNVYGMPVCIKSPDDELLTAEKKAAIQADFTVLENLIKGHTITQVAARLDLRSLMNFLIIQELTMNVELAAPRSMYMYRTADRVWHFGPPWDFDAGFCFDWGQMYTGHNYFGNYNQMILGTNPADPGSGWGRVPGFFRDMFKNNYFVTEYKAYWNSIKGKLLPQTFAKLENYRHQIEEPMRRHYTLWNAADHNFNKRFDTEYPRLLQWLANRFQVMDQVINNYPVPN